MSEREHPQSEFAEAAAAPYRADAATLRDVLERVAAAYPIQPCRVVEDASGDEPVLRLEYWVIKLPIIHDYRMHGYMMRCVM